MFMGTSGMDYFLPSLPFLFPLSRLSLLWGEGHCSGLVISMRMNVEAGIQDRELNEHALGGIFHAP